MQPTSPLQETAATGFETKAFTFDGASTVLVAPSSVDIFNGSGGSISFGQKMIPLLTRLL